MSIMREQLLAKARELPTAERKELIEDLRQLGADDEISQDQRNELRRRIDAIDRGEGEMIDGEQAMNELFAGLRHRPGSWTK